RSSCSYAQDGVYHLRSMGVGAVYPQARLGVPLQKKMMKELLSWGPDIVHSNCEFSTFPAACHIAEKADAPLVHTYHTVYENYWNSQENRTPNMPGYATCACADSHRLRLTSGGR